MKRWTTEEVEQIITESCNAWLLQFSAPAEDGSSLYRAQRASKIVIEATRDEILRAPQGEKQMSTTNNKRKEALGELTHSQLVELCYATERYAKSNLAGRDATIAEKDAEIERLKKDDAYREWSYADELKQEIAKLKSELTALRERLDWKKAEGAFFDYCDRNLMVELWNVNEGIGDIESIHDVLWNAWTHYRIIHPPSTKEAQDGKE